MTNKIEKITAYTDEGGWPVSRTVDGPANSARKTILDKYLGSTHKYPSYVPNAWLCGKRFFNKKTAATYANETYADGYKSGYSDAYAHAARKQREKFLEFYADIQRERKKVDDNVAEITAA